jgi:hypothetical protein
VARIWINPTGERGGAFLNRIKFRPIRNNHSS